MQIHRAKLYVKYSKVLDRSTDVNISAARIRLRLAFRKREHGTDVLRYTLSGRAFLFLFLPDLRRSVDAALSFVFLKALFSYSSLSLPGIRIFYLPLVWKSFSSANLVLACAES